MHLQEPEHESSWVQLPTEPRMDKFYLRQKPQVSPVKTSDWDRAVIIKNLVFGYVILIKQHDETIYRLIIFCNDCYDNFRIIYDKIDKNGDEKVTEQELEDWMRYVQTRYVRMNTDRQWSEHNPDDTATLSWESYKHRVYAFTEGLLTEHFTL